MLWLSQVVFAGMGALLGAQFAVNGHLPLPLAILAAAVVAAVVGAAIGLLTIRLGDLYVALVTLTFSLLVETLFFTRDRFTQGGLGVALLRPTSVADDLTFAYVILGVFAVFALLILNLRRSTSGMALRAVRDSERASRTLGLSVVQVKVIVGALAAFVAAVGGGLLALTVGSAQPASYPTFLGLVWLAIVVTLGIRSISAAIVAGLASTLLPGLFQTYLPTRLGDVPAILFGLGAIAVAQHPEGPVVHLGQQVRGLATRLTQPRMQLSAAIVVPPAPSSARPAQSEVAR
jgi:branched-chain amino acid transport system permease protein